MATGHAVAALMLTRDRKLGEENRISQALERAIDWLRCTQNTDGGWGVEPSSSSDGCETRIASTYYALRSAIYIKPTPDNIRTIDRLAELFVAIQRDDGGWPFFQGIRVDDVSEVSNTSRVIMLLGAASHSYRNVIAKGINYLKAAKFGKSWRLSAEQFYADSSHAQNVYHNNSPCDALLPLLDRESNAGETIDGVQWLIETQRENGSWALYCPDAAHRDYYKSVTWPTAEFIFVMDKAYNTYFERR
jgi:prenyltransferase beta subunit